MRCVFLACLMSRLAMAQLLTPASLGPTQAVQPFAAANRQEAAGLATLPNGRLLVVWVDFGRNPVLGEVRAAVLDPATLAVSFVTLDQPELRAEEPEVACGISSCVIIWLGRSLEDTPVIRGQRLDASGAPMGPSVTFNAPVSRARSQLSVALGPGDAVAVTWREVSVTTLTADTVSGQRLLGPLGVSDPLGNALRPTVAWTSQGLAIADVNEVNGPAYELFFQRREVDRGVLTPRTNLGTNVAGQVRPRLVSAGDDVVLTAVRDVGTSYGALTIAPVIDGMPGLERVFTMSGSFGRPSAVKVGASWVFIVSDEVGSTRGLRVGRFDVDAGVAVDLGQVPGGPPTEYPNVVHTPTSLAVAGGALWVATTAGATALEPDVVIGQLQLSPFALTPDGGAHVFFTAPEQTSPRAVIGPSGGLAGWVEHVSPEEARVFGRPLDARGAALGPARLVGGTVLHANAIRALELLPTSNGAAVAWIAGTDRETLNLLQVDSTGAPRGLEQMLFPTDYSLPTRPALTTVDGLPWALYSIVLAPRGLWVSRGLTDGGWAAPENLVATSTLFDSVGVASNGSELFVAWTFAGGVWGTRVFFDGGVASDHLAGALHQYLAEDVSVASDGTDFLVAWRNRDLAAEHVLGAVVSGSTGGRVGTNVMLVASSETSWSWGRASPSPQLGFDGTDYVMTFDLVSPDGGSGVLVRTVSRTGQPGATRVLADGPQHEFDGRLFFDGRGRTLATWTQSTAEPNTQAWGALSLSLAGGEACVAPGDCRSGRCQASRCCEVDGGCSFGDAGFADAGLGDDAGVLLDAGVDSGVMDAGEGDSGVVDAGAAGDAGVDGGLDDGGLDDGGAPDGGAVDAGVQPPVAVRRALSVGCASSGLELGWALLLVAWWATRGRKRVFSRAWRASSTHALPRP